ncbi:SAM-dependent methyltransferase, partial [Myxococcota bacterium]|nr:SAM-dependent methyltransferase [Myxococcota bacterium]
SGGMFVSSARFVSEHRANPAAELAIHGVEKTDDTGRLCRLNLAVHGLEGDIRHGGNVNSYYDDPHAAVGRFDFVLANPPFNVNAVDKERLKDAVGPGRRFPFGLPNTDNANYLWIQLFYSSLAPTGRAGFVMANSASDARSSEQELRRRLLEARAVEAMVAVGPNMFYTVTLPCTLWFLDRGKAGTPRADTVLFIDARHIYRQIDRAHREWTPAQIGFLANLVRLYRGEAVDPTLGGDETVAKLSEIFGKKPKYADVPGLCKAATLAEIEAQGWSLNPGRYVGVAPGETVSDEDFKSKLEQLNEELVTLNAQARELEQTIAANVARILES